MGSKEDILARLKKHAVDQVERPEMTFEPLTFSDPLVIAWCWRKGRT